MIEPVIRSTPLWGGLDQTMMQINRTAKETGNRATAERMYIASDHVSNAGNETHIGTSEFSKTNDRLVEIGVDAISKIMEADDKFEGSKFGNTPQTGPTGFQQFNDFSYQTQQRVAADAYKYFAG